MAENYKDMESLEDIKKLIDNGCSVTGVPIAVGISPIATPIGSAAIGATVGSVLGPEGLLVGAGIGLLLNRSIKKKQEMERQKRFYEYKLSLYTKALQVQNALIKKLKDELNMERSERKYIAELNEKLQDVIRKLKGDLNI